MPITEHQRQARKSHIGSSDAPVICGVLPYEKPTLADIYWSKVASADRQDKPNKAMTVGNYLEGLLTDYLADQLGCKLVRNQYRVCQDDPIFAANHDALVVREGQPRAGVECKYVGQGQRDAWGEEGTDQIPDHVMIQVQHQMMVSHLETVWLPVAIAGFSLDLRIYTAKRNEKLINIIREKGRQFWHEHVEPRKPPENCGPPPIEILNAIDRPEGTQVELAEDALLLWEEYQKLGNEIKELTAKRQQTKAAIVTQLEEAEIGVLPDGAMLTYRAQNSAPSVNVKLLRIEKPEIYNAYVSQGQHRVLRYKKPPTRKKQS